MGACLLGCNAHCNRCFYSYNYDELISKVIEPYELYEFDSLKEFAEAIIKFGWKSYGEYE